MKNATDSPNKKTPTRNNIHLEKLEDKLRAVETELKTSKDNEYKLSIEKQYLMDMIGDENKNQDQV